MLRLNHVLFLVLLFFALPANASTVRYPSLTQPGSAHISTINGGWTFSNNLFSASFIQNNGKIFFGGSEEMGLDAGTEIFEIVLGTGTKVKASQMTWGNIAVEDLYGNPAAEKTSETLDGKALTATLTYSSMTFKWRALLRDGSHYLRTELEISTTANTAMTSITPMLYKVRNEGGKAAPVVVGNTRGAVVASDYIFAGVETPMAFNAVSGAQSTIPFNAKAWTVESWTAMPVDAPTAVLNLGFSQGQLVVSQGEVEISDAGALNIKFQYASGTHRMNLAGVDLLKNGVVVASDYHIGFTGSAASNNSYTLNVPATGKYTLRYIGEVKTETITSTGNITLTGPSVTVLTTYSPSTWTPIAWKTASLVPSEITALGFNSTDIVSTEGNVYISKAINVGITFQYVSGNNRLNLVGVDILNSSGAVVASDYHIGNTGGNSVNNIYTIDLPSAGVYTLRYFAEIKSEAITSTGSVTFANATVSVPSAESTLITGKWSRNTTLLTTDTFRVSTVVGMVAEDQLRRSFLAYHERERAVPWRSFIHYNSWYELNITNNNNSDPLKRMTEQMCMPVMNAWKTNLFDAHGVGIDAFVWDDGWDDFNSLWDFHIGFPNGFDAVNARATELGSGIGAWLGPVGGYGSAKAQRLAFWNSTHSPSIGNFELSNKEYFDAFLGRCSQMVDDYDMRFFKLDGISAQFSAVGPSAEEDAEGIVKVLSALRKKREDIFLNCTVGTWASPFWFHYADAVWRQENDYDEVGNQGNSREKWITYRDRLVHQNFVTNSPLCPINSLMTHGLIVTKNGPPAAMPRDNSAATVKGIVKEMRCAFASGSGMVELYLDSELMNTIGSNKVLWKELASCINWHRGNKDVLADTHWVGGNPWDGTKANVYGWASWSPAKSTLTLRNPSATTKVFTTTLRKALDIPSYVSGKILLTDAFTGQTQYEGITNSLVDIDATISFNLAPFDVVVLDGKTDGVAALDVTVDASKLYGDIFGEKGKVGLKNIEANSRVLIVDMTGMTVSDTKSAVSDFSVKVPRVGIYLVQVLNENGKLVRSQKVVCN